MGLSVTRLGRCPCMPPVRRWRRRSASTSRLMTDAALSSHTSGWISSRPFVLQCINNGPGFRTDHSVHDKAEPLLELPDRCFGLWAKAPVDPARIKANQSRRLLSLAAVVDGMNRTEAARIGGMDRQTLRDWVHRFNAHGPNGLLDGWSKGPEPRLSAEQRAELAELVETGPDRAVHGVVRWRRVDLQRVIRERFGVAYHERTVGKLLKALGFSHISARPRHPAQDQRTIEAFKKTSRLR